VAAEFSNLGAALAEALPRLWGVSAATDPLLLSLITALGAALERGQLELPLDGPVPRELQPQFWPGGYRAALEGSPLVVQASRLDERPEAPLVLDGQRLRWRRWHLQLNQVIAVLIQRAQEPLAPMAAAAPMASATQLEAARRQAAAAGLDSDQQRAVTALLAQRLVLVCGGPGTGKTSTVVAMLAAHLDLWPAAKLHLAAPTGKAATRLRFAIESGCKRLSSGAATAVLLAAPCSTLHRLLESNGQRYGRDHRQPLELDLLVVDELSMVDLPLMAALLDALPASCRLVLVGDPAQLPPVGPGAVLLELMRPGRLAALGAAAVELVTPYRNTGAIASVAAALRPEGDPGEQARLEPDSWAVPAEAAGSADAYWGRAGLEQLPRQLAQLHPSDNLQWLQAPAHAAPPAALRRLRQHQRRLAELAAAASDQWIAAAPLAAGDSAAGSSAVEGEAARALLAELESCILLTPLRQGSWGVASIHRQLLGEQIETEPAQWPLGTPVLNRRNLPEQGLANGDIGVVVEQGGERRILFPGPRLLHPARIGAAEPALALTVHKAQGSQYGEVWLLLPPGRSWDVRLLYTGLTRAQHRAWLITPHGISKPPAATLGLV
jgi:exodeoxyribonuclease V alpha subunit